MDLSETEKPWQREEKGKFYGSRETAGIQGAPCRQHGETDWVGVRSCQAEKEGSDIGKKGTGKMHLCINSVARSP